MKKKAPRNRALTCREAEINRLPTAIFQVLRPVNEKEMMAYAGQETPSATSTTTHPVTRPPKGIILMITTSHRNKSDGESVLWKEHSNL